MILDEIVLLGFIACGILVTLFVCYVCGCDILKFKRGTLKWYHKLIAGPMFLCLCIFWSAMALTIIMIVGGILYLIIHLV